MPGVTVHFLLVYSHTAQKLIEQEQYTRIAEATAAYKAAEEKYRDRSDEFEVVLVGADSIGTVMRTHGHYFVNDSLFDKLLEAAANSKRTDFAVAI